MNPAMIRCAVATAIVVTLCGTARAAEVNIPVKDMHGDDAGSIDVTTSTDAMGKVTIVADYVPEENTTTDQAAEALWGDHLNWVNIVVTGTPGATPDDPDGGGSQDYPLLDPLPGGNSGGGFAEVDADDLPFYLDENNANDDGGLSAQDLMDNLSPGSLVFEDGPSYTGEVMWKFNTYLAAINGGIDASDTDKTFHIVAGFMWTFNQDTSGVKTITNIMPITIDNSTIKSHLDLVNTAMDDHAATKDWEATSHIPEPATLAVLLPIVLMRRRRLP